MAMLVITRGYLLLIDYADRIQTTSFVSREPKTAASRLPGFQFQSLLLGVTQHIAMESNYIVLSISTVCIGYIIVH